jgi:hypothetical protein
MVVGVGEVMNTVEYSKFEKSSIFLETAGFVRINYERSK